MVIFLIWAALKAFTHTKGYRYVVVMHEAGIIFVCLCDTWGWYYYCMPKVSMLCAFLKKMSEHGFIHFYFWGWQHRLLEWRAWCALEFWFWHQWIIFNRCGMQCLNLPCFHHASYWFTYNSPYKSQCEYNSNIYQTDFKLTLTKTQTDVKCKPFICISFCLRPMYTSSKVPHTGFFLCPKFWESPIGKIMDVEIGM